MAPNDELRARVMQFKQQCDAICEEARQMVVANRALMRIPEHAKRSRLAEQSIEQNLDENKNSRRERHKHLAQVFVRSLDDLFRLVRTDLDLAFTFANMSQETDNPERKRRLARNAFLAYETALRIKAEVTPPPDQKRDLDVQLFRLQSKLADLAKSMHGTFSQFPRR